MITITTYADPEGSLKYQHFMLTSDTDRHEWFGGQYLTFGKGEVFTEDSAGGFHWHETDLRSEAAMETQERWDRVLVEDKGWTKTTKTI